MKRDLQMDNEMNKTKVTQKSAKSNKYPICESFMDTKSNASKVLKALRFGDTMSSKELMNATGLLQSSNYSAIRYLLRNPELCNITVTGGCRANNDNEAARFKLNEVHIKMSAYVGLSKSKNKPKQNGRIPRKFKGKVIRELSGLSMSPVGFGSGANGYGQLCKYVG